MTKHECAVIMAFTGVAMLKGNDLDIFYEYIAKILGRPVYTHEMAMLSEEIKEASRNDFVQLCRNASEKPKSNADRIRQMTDEELARFLINFDMCIVCQVKCTKEYPCNKGIMEWLKRQEARKDAAD